MFFRRRKGWVLANDPYLEGAEDSLGEDRAWVAVLGRGWRCLRGWLGPEVEQSWDGRGQKPGPQWVWGPALR